MAESGLVRLEIDESAVDVDLLRAVLMEKTKPSTREGHYQRFAQDFSQFFPDLIRHCQTLDQVGSKDR